MTFAEFTDLLETGSLVYFEILDGHSEKKSIQQQSVADSKYAEYEVIAVDFEDRSVVLRAPTFNVSLGYGRLWQDEVKMQDSYSEKTEQQVIKLITDFITNKFVGDSMYMVIEKNAK